MADQTLAVPAAIQESITGCFWNPVAPANGPGFAAGVLAIQTPQYGVIEREIRPVVALGLNLGRYRLAVARGEGLNGLGTNYRIELDLDLDR